VCLEKLREPGTFRSVETQDGRTLGGAVAWTTVPDELGGAVSGRTRGRISFAPCRSSGPADALTRRTSNTSTTGSGKGEIDFFMLQSDGQAETYHDAPSLPAWQIFRTKSGPQRRQSKPVRAVASAVTRSGGFAYAARRSAVWTPPLLIDVFPRIRADVHDASREVVSSMQVYCMKEADEPATVKAVYRRTKQPGCDTCRLDAASSSWPRRLRRPSRVSQSRRREVLKLRH